MPTVSGPAAADRVTIDGRNIALPGIATGLEPLLIARRLWPHNAVFVLERDPLQIRLALSLHDYGDVLRAGRVVLVAGEDVEGGLERFFETHAGYEFPLTMLPLPRPEADAQARFAVVQRMVETAGARVAKAQASAVQGVVNRLAAGAASRDCAEPRFAVLGLDPRLDGIEQARRVGRGLAHWGVVHAVSVPDRPDACHALARLQCVAQIEANVVVFVGAAPGQLARLLPERIAVCSLFPPGSTAGADLRLEFAAHHRVFAASAEVGEGLVRGGLPAERVEYLAPAADTALFQPDPERRSRAAGEIAVLCDLPAEDPRAWGVVLPSHVALFQACARVMESCVDDYRADRAESILRRGEEACGTELREPAVRGQFLGMIRAVIAPRALARAAWDVLLGTGHRVAVWGNGWQGGAAPAEARRGAIPRGEALRRVLWDSSAVVLPVGSGLDVQVALDALATGTAVFLRGDAVSLSRQFPQVDAILPHVSLFGTRSGLASALHGLGRADARGAAALASQLVAEHHSVAARMRTLWHALRSGERQEAGRAVVHA